MKPTTQEELMKHTTIQLIDKGFVLCSCGEYYCNPFRCPSCGLNRENGKKRYTFLESQAKYIPIK